MNFRTLGSFCLLFSLLFAASANDCTTATALTLGGTATVNFDNTPDFTGTPQYPCPATPGVGDAWFSWVPGGTSASQFNVGFDITTNFNGLFNVYLLYSESFEMGDPCEYPPATGTGNNTGLTRYQSACNVNILGGAGNIFEFDNAGLDGSGHFFVVVERISGTNGGNEQVSVNLILNGNCSPPSNDNCANPITLAVGNGIDSNYAIPTIPAWSDALKGTISCATKERIAVSCAGGPPTPTEDHYGSRLFSNCFFGGTVGAVGSLTTGLITHCDEYLENTVWFSFVAPMTATDWQLHIGSTGVCPQEPNNLAVMLLSNVDCNNANNTSRVDCGKFGFANLVPSAGGTLDGLTGTGFTLFQGQTYYILVDGTRASQCDFCLLLTRSPINPVLPATVENLTGWNEGPTNIVSWQTSEEIKHDYFSIERSRDGQYFESVGTVQGVGESAQRQYYDFEDRNAPIGKTYYRLNIVDLNGNTFATETIEIVREEVQLSLYEAYPVPFRERLTVYYSTPNEMPLTIRMIDIQGKVVLDQHFETRRGSQELSLDTQGLASGMYILQLEQAGKTASRKVVK